MSAQQVNKYYLAVATGCFFLMFAFSIGIVGLSFFVKPVSEDLGLERGPFTFYFSLIFLVGMLVTPWVGKFINQKGAKAIVLAGSVVVSLALAFFSFARSLPAFYAIAIFMGFLFHGSSVLAATTSVNLWFEKKRGLMLGLASSASGVGGAVFSFILPRFISAYGWRNAYLFLAVCWLILTLPTGLFLIRNRPETYGLTPYGAKAVAGSNAYKTQEISGMPLSQAKRSSSFYLLLLSFFLVSMVLSSNQHLPSHFAGIGLSEGRLGNLMSTYSIFVIGYKIMFGTLSDKIGLRRSLVIISFCGILSYLLIRPIQDYGLLFFIIFLMAAFNPAISILPSMTTFQIFGSRDFPAIWALLGMAGSFGQFVGPPLWGLIFDLTGTYQPVFIGIPFMILAAFLLNYYCLWKARKKIY